MRIILDIDDVLSDTFRALESRFGKADDPTVDNLQLMFPNADVMPIFEDEVFHQSIAPLDGASAGVRWLLDAGHEARYLSSRPLSMERATAEWLTRWQFPDLPLQCAGRDAKKAALRSDSYDLLIDDMLRYLTIAKERGSRAIAFANPWNTTWSGESAADWSELRELL